MADTLAIALVTADQRRHRGEAATHLLHRGMLPDYLARKPERDRAFPIVE